MQQFLKWTLNEMRKEGSMMSWMEEKRFEWVPLAASMLKNLLNGHTFIIVTDDERKWFCKYILSTINNPKGARPLLPFYSLEMLYPNLSQVRQKEEISLLEDLLSHSFPGGYTFFYIGKNENNKMELAKRKDNSFMWVFDEQLQDSFYLSSSDDMLDVKLIQLFKLLNKSIDAVLFAEVVFEND
ncbi:MAG: HobA family DNA replication regulator [Sulfurospirillaceae bacterium]|nr:HobA family DNA replication regulator [Sulfurospirillaceae bacterium]